MALPWVRLDTALPDHPKVLALIDGHKEGKATAFVYICGMAYSGKHETAGFIPKEALARINGRAADAARLVEVGLWELHTGGWQINSWDEYQIANDEAKARRGRAKAAAEVRWAKEKGRPAHAPRIAK